MKSQQRFTLEQHSNIKNREDRKINFMSLILSVLNKHLLYISLD